MSMADGYGLQPFKRGAATPGAYASGEALHSSSRGLADSHNPSPVYAKARADAFEKQRLAHEADCAAFYIAKGPFKFHCGTASWTLRTGDPTRAETLTLHPLPSRSVKDLLQAGIIDTSGVIEEAFKRAVAALGR
jgi:hypothetical protein